MNNSRWLTLVRDTLGDSARLTALGEGETIERRIAWWGHFSQSIPWVDPPWKDVPTQGGIIGGSSVIYGEKAREGYKSLQAAQVLLFSQSVKRPCLSVELDSMPDVDRWDDLGDGGFVIVCHPDFRWSVAFFGNRIGFPSSPSLAVR